MSQSKSRHKNRSKSRSKSIDSLNKAAEKKGNKKKIHSDGIDFLSLLLGMITTLLIGLLVYSQFSGSPGAARALVAAETGDASNEVNSIDKDDFEELVESGNAEQLKNVLSGLGQSVISGKPSERVTANLRRIDVANKMLTMKLSEDERKQAIVSKLDALTMNYGFTFSPKIEIPSAVANLKTNARKYAQDSDQDIRRTARMGLFNLEAFEMIKEGNEPDVNYLAEEIGKLFKDFPQDDLVLSNIGIVMGRYRKKYDRKVADQVAQILNSRKEEFESQKARAVIRDMVDESKLLEAKYVELFGNRWVNAEQSQRELFIKSKELANELDPGLKIINSVDQVAHWFEQNDQYDRSIEIYEEIAKASDTYSNADVAADAKKKAADGILRGKLVTQKIDLLGLQYNGKRLPESVVKDKVVLVVFWSVFDQPSIGLIKRLNREAHDWELHGVRILAVNVDRKRIPNVEPIVLSAKENIFFLVGDPKKNFDNHVLKQCPSDQVPRAMLINRDGTVADVSVPITELNTEIDYMINK